MIASNADFPTISRFIVFLSKTAGLHLFKVFANGKLATSPKHENLDICLFIILLVAHIYTIILTWKSNEESNLSDSIVINLGLRTFIFGGLIIDIFILFWNFMHATQILEYMNNFKRFDYEVGVKHAERDILFCKRSITYIHIALKYF